MTLLHVGNYLTRCDMSHFLLFSFHFTQLNQKRSQRDSVQSTHLRLMYPIMNIMTSIMETDRWTSTYHEAP